MKKSLTNFLKFGTFLLGISLLWNCEKNTEVIPEIEASNYIIGHKTYDFISDNKELIHKINSFSKAKGKQVLSAKERAIKTADFTIFTDKVTYLKRQGKTKESYSFYIESDKGKELNKIENLILSKDLSTNEYKSYIITYLFPNGINGTEANFEIVNFKEIDISRISEGNFNPLKSRNCGYEYSVSETKHDCYSGAHSGDAERDNCDGNGAGPYSTWAIYSQFTCDGGGGGAGGSSTVGSGSGNPTGSGNTGNGNGGSDAVETGIVLPPSCLSDNCEEEILANQINELLNKSLSHEELIWLNSNDIQANIIKTFINRNINSTKVQKWVKEAIKTYMFGTAEEIAATNMTLIINSNNNLQNISYDTSFFNQINQYTTVDLSDPYIQSIWIAHFSAQCAIVKLQNPDWSDYKIYWEASKEIIHIGLDIGGMVPVVGEVCDITNGIIYTVQGDGVNAALSFSAAIPIVGWAATGSKYAYKLTQYTINGTKIKLVLRILNDGSVYFGSSGSKLRKALGLTDAAKHAHHLIPWALRNHSVVEKAAKSKSAFHINEVLNGIPRLSNLHLTGHKVYNQKIQGILKTFDSNGSPDKAYNFVSGLANHIRTVIQNNPNLNSGQIANLITFPN